MVRKLFFGAGGACDPSAPNGRLHRVFEGCCFHGVQIVLAPLAAGKLESAKFALRSPGRHVSRRRFKSASEWNEGQLGHDTRPCLWRERYRTLSPTNAKGGAVMGFIRFPLCPVVDIKNGALRDLKLAAPVINIAQTPSQKNARLACRDWNHSRRTGLSKYCRMPSPRGLSTRLRAGPFVERPSW
jgi:hypothetical protein